jgi:N-acetylglucosaminyl-diphospho-decaprenol L-rhamnosyltransferase
LPPLDDSPWMSLSLLRNSRPTGYARNHNRAFDLATGEYFCIVNPDVVFLEPLFPSLIALIESGQGHIVAPLVIDSQGSVQDSFRDLPAPIDLLRRRLGKPPDASASAPGQVIHPDWIAGIFLMMRRDTFAGLGGLDERYRLYFEDVDLCTRARLAGLQLAVDCRVHLRHDARRASRRLGPHLARHLQSAFRFYTSRVYWNARRKLTHG